MAEISLPAGEGDLFLDAAEHSDTPSLETTSTNQAFPSEASNFLLITLLLTFHLSRTMARMSHKFFSSFY